MMSQHDGKKPEEPGAKPRKKGKDIHVEIAPMNWKNIEAALEAYNENPGRVTPKIKADHLINEAIDRYLREPGGKSGNA
jgi:hypothetical protein